MKTFTNVNKPKWVTKPGFYGKIMLLSFSVTERSAFMRRLLPMLFAVLLLITPLAASADQTLTLTFTGDCTLGSEQIKQYLPDSLVQVAQQVGYDYFFENVRDLTMNDDLTVINLENVFSDYANEENKNKVYRFRAPKEYVKIITGSGVEACNLANNHTYDFGSQGLRNTKKTLDEAGIGWFGDRDYYIWEKNGIKIALFGMWNSQYQSNKEWYAEKIASLKEDEGVNCVIFTFHCGQEYSGVHNPSQEKFSKFAINAGCDLVVMHHPHVVQGITTINNRYVVYSLGNFVFGGNCKVRALETMVVQALLTFDDAGQFKGSQLKIYPMHISDDPEVNHYQPQRVAGEEAENVLELVRADSTIEIPAYDEELGCVVLPYLEAEPPALKDVP